MGARGKHAGDARRGEWNSSRQWRVLESTGDESAHILKTHRLPAWGNSVNWINEAKFVKYSLCPLAFAIRGSCQFPKSTKGGVFPQKPEIEMVASWVSVCCFTISENQL